MANWLLGYRQKQARRALTDATDWPRRHAECQVRLAVALGFLRTIPGEDVDPEEAEAWWGRVQRFLAQIDGGGSGE